MTPPPAAAAAAPATRPRPTRPRRAPSKTPTKRKRAGPSRSPNPRADGSRPKMNVYRSGTAKPGAAGRAGVAAAGRVGLAVRELPDSGLVVRLTRGRAWIAVLGSLLAGIVALNVVSLGLTAGSGQVGQQIDQLQRENSALRGDLAEKLSATRIQAAAPGLGLSTPPAGDITYLEYKPSDLSRAAKVLAGEITSAAAPWVPSSEAEAATAASSGTVTTQSATVEAVAPTAAAPESATATSSPEPAAPAPSAPSAPSSSTASGGVGSAGL